MGDKTFSGAKFRRLFINIRVGYTYVHIYIYDTFFSRDINIFFFDEIQKRNISRRA